MLILGLFVVGDIKAAVLPTLVEKIGDTALDDGRAAPLQFEVDFAIGTGGGLAEDSVDLAALFGAVLCNQFEGALWVVPLLHDVGVVVLAFGHEGLIGPTADTKTNEFTVVLQRRCLSKRFSGPNVVERRGSRVDHAERFFTVLVNDVLDAVFGLQVPD